MHNCCTHLLLSYLTTAATVFQTVFVPQENHGNKSSKLPYIFGQDRGKSRRSITIVIYCLQTLKSLSGCTVNVKQWYCPSQKWIYNQDAIKVIKKRLSDGKKQMKFMSSNKLAQTWRMGLILWHWMYIHNADFAHILSIITALMRNHGDEQTSWHMPNITV